MHHHTDVHLRAEQRVSTVYSKTRRTQANTLQRHCTDPLREPQSRLLRLLLPRHHGRLQQICRGTGVHPGFSVLGGMTTFLFSAVAVSGIRIISTIPFTRRNRFILTAAMSIGFGATLVPTWFSYVFTYSGDNHALEGFFNAIELVMETGFAVTAFLALILNLMLAEEIEDEAVDITANTIDEQADQQEWERIRRPSTVRAARRSAELQKSSEGTASLSPDGKGDVEKMDLVKEV
jgi:hypothetical protein